MGQAIPFTLHQNNIHILPILHHTMEFAAEVEIAIRTLKPDCIAVELPQELSKLCIEAAARLPDISVIVQNKNSLHPIYYLCEPCDPAFAALRYAVETPSITPYCIDLYFEDYPNIVEHFPDPFAINSIGAKAYYENYEKYANQAKHDLDILRELHMARCLKELSLRHDKVLLITGMSHAQSIFEKFNLPKFPVFNSDSIQESILCTLTDKSCREGLPEYGWLCLQYEFWREQLNSGSSVIPSLNRQELILNLYKEASKEYIKQTGNNFEHYHLSNTMKFARNYALVTQRLLPDLYQQLTAARGCVDHNYAYATWYLATDYPLRKNIDQLPELDLSVEELWGYSKKISFQLKQRSRKDTPFKIRTKDKKGTIKYPPSPFFGMCSYPPEDIVIEKFADYLKKKGVQIVGDEQVRIEPFSTSIEDGIDTRETIRHWTEKKLYVRVKGKAPSGTGSIVVIFDEDISGEKLQQKEKYPWCMTWIGEHNQESDMALYATHPRNNVVGPGISRCEYGGFMMSYPPQRMQDIWHDPDYSQCHTKAEVLLMAAIDYAIQPVVAYIAKKPPRSLFRSFAARYGKKLVFIPLSQLSPIILNKLRVFHVLDGHAKRDIADEYIY
ncbi:MAG: hypothetical protein K0S74_686 [Chlamydiales bacterium]|jgi:hypothetical protein|nr:hypothetical protein [Chlamydiales bacterium]